jgi:hypothetical protein
VYFKLDDASFPSNLREPHGRFVGISDHVGHAMTYMILTDDTQKIIHQYNVRTALDPLTPNKQVDPPSVEDYQPPPIRRLSKQMFGEKPTTKVHSPLEKGDHPELDTLELLDQTGVQQYQLLIGSLQWAWRL